MTEQEYIKRIDAGEEFSESEISNLVYDYEYEVISGECHRWTQLMTTIVKLCDRYFAIYWEKGLTEYQEDSFWSDSIEEVKPKEKVVTVTVTDWVTVKGDMCLATSSN